MDAFMGHLLAAIQADGDDAMRVFPAEAAISVMLAYVERLATDVVRRAIFSWQMMAAIANRQDTSCLAG